MSTFFKSLNQITTATYSGTYTSGTVHNGNTSYTVPAGKWAIAVLASVGGGTSFDGFNIYWRPSSVSIVNRSGTLYANTPRFTRSNWKQGAAGGFIVNSNQGNLVLTAGEVLSVSCYMPSFSGAFSLSFTIYEFNI